MTRIWCSAAVIGLMLAGSMLLMIQGSAWDGHDLLTALDSTDCGAPCFINIQPGTTTYRQAYDRLQAHQWVAADNIMSNVNEAGDGMMSWTWNGRQPAVLRTPYLNAGEIEIQAGLVRSIRLRTAIPFGYVWLTLGRPQSGFTRPSRIYLGRLANHLAGYPSRGLTIQTLVRYPALADIFWNAPVDLLFNTTISSSGRYEAPCWLRCD